ncbi:glycosyltransferase [Candidatus Fermentibacteria bacterium]|nr:glycosyltransferase [Candidatus Fermentibacteria bacterium]
MRLAYVHTGLWPSDSPSTTFTTYNAAALAEECDRFWLFNKRNYEGSVKEVLNNRFGMEMPPDLELRSLRWLLRFTNRLYYRRVLRQLRSIHRRLGLDAVISRNVTFLSHLAGLREELGVPAVFESHDFYADLSERSDAGRGAVRRSRLERRYLPQVSCLVCLQESQRKLYREAFPDLRIELARTGIHRVHPRTEPGRFVTYVGSLEDRKGIEVLLRAARASQSKPPLLIVGGRSADEVENVRQAAAGLAPDVSIELTGWVGKPELSRLLGRTAIGLLPLRDTFFNRHVTSPLKLFDYLAHGVPVIASDLPTLRELIVEGSTGLFYRPEDSDQLAGRIDELWEDPERRAGMTESIYEECPKYLWSNRAKKLVGVVRELGKR